MQRGSHQKKQRSFVGQLAPGEISESREFSAGAVPLHARPLVKTLQWQVNIFVGFEFQHCQSSGHGRGQHVEHGAVGGGEGRDLRIKTGRIKALVERRDIFDDQRFQPAFGMHPP